MQSISYIGEHLWAGKLGNTFLVLSFLSSLLALAGFCLSVKDRAHLKFARATFYLHAFSVIGIAGTLFFMLFNHYFEYQYVWQHSNMEMPMRFIFSCFWEGQEGSFLLWTFWNVILGVILQRSLKNEWEAPVMAVFSLVQVFLASMLLGIYFGDVKIGSNPFLLLREHPEFSNLPFVKVADYVSKLQPRGLNPLLMNYWMTIHPPTLFLGFASTLIPFAFAIAGLWNRKYDQWQIMALPWTYFGILILGVGILMGGAWAYEALSFGGFWAWDPVENSSLVPWLILVGAGHVMIVNKNKGGSLFTTHLLAIGSFLLVLYSTFLTRSGVLGDASVHAFTDLGMQGQLVVYVLTFVLLCVALLIESSLLRVTYVIISLLLAYFAVLYSFKRDALLIWTSLTLGLSIFAYVKYFPKEKDEEELFSREFWIFLGALLLLLSSLIITYFTSIPVLNKLFGLKKAPLKIEDYNIWMVPFAILMLILIASGLFLKFKKTDKKEFFRKLKYSVIISLVFGLACSVPLYLAKDFSNASGIQKWNLISYCLLFITGAFAVTANLDYWLRMLKGKIMKGGAAIAHIGFALIMVGALVSVSKKQTLSQQTPSKKAQKLGEEFNDQKSILLPKGDTIPMGPYLVSYAEKERKGIDVYFKVNYFKPGADGKPELVFQLTPKMQENPRMGRAPEPGTRHYLNRDVYTVVTAYPNFEEEVDEKNKNAFGKPKNYVAHVGDTIIASNAIVIIDSLKTNVNEQEYAQSDSLLEVTAVLKAFDEYGRVYKASPKYVIRNNMVIPESDEINALGLKFTFWKINPEMGSIEIGLSEKAGNTKDFIVMEAYLFPYINVLWLGCVVMAIGTGIAVIERRRKLKISQSKLGT